MRLPIQRKQLPVVIAVAALAGLALAACGSGVPSSSSTSANPSTAVSSSNPAPAVSSSPSATAKTNAAAQPGGYITLSTYEQNPAAYADNQVVLFFNAAWCPTCKAANQNLTASAGEFPAGLTVVSVDYDSNAELKRKYGITYQHTFVEVGPDGNQLKKWSGSETVEQIQQKVAG